MHTFNKMENLDFFSFMDVDDPDVKSESCTEEIQNVPELKISPEGKKMRIDLTASPPSTVDLPFTFDDISDFVPSVVFADELGPDDLLELFKSLDQATVLCGAQEDGMNDMLISFLDVHFQDVDKVQLFGPLAEAKEVNQQLQDRWKDYLAYLETKKAENLEKQRKLNEEIEQLTEKLPQPTKEIGPVQGIKLRDAVKNQLIDLAFTEKYGPERELLERKKAVQQAAGRGSMTTAKKLNKIHQKIFALQDRTNSAHESLFFNKSIHQVDKIDWERIAQQIPQSSADEYRRWWQHNRPDVKTGPFSDEEKRILRKLKKADFKVGIDWEEVADNLATQTGSKLKRTPFACFSYFQQHLNGKHRVFGWPKKDDEKLNQLVGGKDSSTIDWAGIASLFPGRSKVQV